MLDKDFIEDRKKDLLTEKERLEKELGSIATKEDGNYVTNFPKIGDEDEDNELEVSEYEQAIDAEKKLVGLLNDTIEALKKIENGTYGHCDNCNQDIDPERLKVYPSAKTCITCEDK
ncbi:TraR/DksA family transcriptional regulator [bacterium]|nr:TraR/DksA family transcriptional regulator [bacterium]